jgi:uncharacterized protein
MSDFKRPGVYLSESLAAPQASTGVSLSNGCFIAPHPRGPVDATLVTSFQQFTSLYGGFTTGVPGDDLMYAVYQFFNNGGRQCYVVRVVDGNEAIADLDLNDRESGTPQVTLTVRAKNPGTWANALYIDIKESPLDANRFTLTVYYGGTGAGNIVERFADLTMDPTDSRYVGAVVNSPTLGSIYVEVDDLGLYPTETLADATPDETATPTVLTGGGDQTGAPAGADWDAAIAKMDSIDSPVTINAPGYTDATTVNKMLTYAANRGDAFVVIDGTTGNDATAAGALTAAATYTATSYGAVYFPRPVIADPASASPGATRVVPPGGAVVGLFVATDAATGVHKTAAGLSARIANAIGLEATLSNTDLDSLNASNVNAIRSLPGSGVVVMGGRTLAKTGRADKYISVRRSLILIKAEVERLAEFALFEPNNELLRESLSAIIEQYLLSFWTAGGLVGAASTEAFYVVCDDTNNSPADVANGIVNVDVGVALQRPAEFIAIKVSQFDGAVSVAEAE